MTDREHLSREATASYRLTSAATRIPAQAMREELNQAIFEELCQGVIRPQTTRLFLDAIDALRSKGADCVILGCTEIPLIITPDNAPLPVLDSTRLLARYAVLEALSERPSTIQAGWLTESGRTFG